jgi:hypothetical protein
MIDIDISNIVINRVYLPVPMRGYSAQRRGNEDGPTGFGVTPELAIADLLEQEQ